MMGTE
jgi:hypothetical protein